MGSLKDTRGYFGWYLIRFIFNISIISAFLSYTVLSVHARVLQSVNTSGKLQFPAGAAIFPAWRHGARMKTVAWYRLFQRQTAFTILTDLFVVSVRCQRKHSISSPYGSMALSEWRLSLKLLDQPSLPKSVLQFPEADPGDVPPGEYRVSTLKQLVSAQIPDAIPDPELIGNI